MKLTNVLKNFVFAMMALSLLALPAASSYAAANTSSNLITNPLLEQANPSNSSLPEGWTTGGWGSNQASFNYLNTGSTGDPNSVNVTVSNYTNGADEWYGAPVAVSAGVQYTYSDSYTATADSEIDAAFTLSDGTTDYMYLGTAAPSASWTTFSNTFTAPSEAVSVQIFHVIYSNGSLTTDNYSLTENQGPSITITAPTNNATVTGTQNLTAQVTDNATIKSVTFEVDGTQIGSPVTASPYQISWNSTGVANGAHTVTAIAQDANGQSATATSAITVNNATVTNGNVLENPTLTTADPNNSADPADWQPVTWGTNTTKFSYLNTGDNDTRSIETQITSYTNGASEWLPASVPVTGDTQYKFSDYYKSNINSEVEIMFNMNDGTQLYEELGFPQASTTWKQYSTVFNAPQGAVSFSVYQFIDQVGNLTTDDYSVAPYTPQGFNRALVTLTFDDGWASTFTNGIPLLKQYGFTSTQFVISGDVGQPDYITKANVKTMAQDGEEIASRTVTHDDMTLESASQLKTELNQSQKNLTTWSGQSLTDFAYPFGNYNANIETQTTKYYKAAHGVEVGLNSKDVFNPENLKVENVFDTTTTAQVADWVAQAQATHTWLILVYHSVSATPTDDYNVTPTNLNSQLAAIKSSGITVENMNTAFAEVEAQIEIRKLAGYRFLRRRERYGALFFLRGK